MLARAHTFALIGVAAQPVKVEVDVNRGLPSFSLVGLPDTAVRESRERVRSAMSNRGFEFPMRRITASLAPADLRKAGPSFDLAIAAGLLAASGQLPGELLDRYALAGELGLDGTVRSVPGVLAMAEAARVDGLEGLAVATANAPEAALVDGLEVIALDRIDRLVGLGRGEWAPPPVEPIPLTADLPAGLPDLRDVHGQPYLCRAMEIAAAGGHNLFMVGPPGAGKSLAARRMPSILPPLTSGEALEVTRIASACGRPPRPGTVAIRPFRAPHHTVSAAGLVGGGNPPRPGEITLAHGGVLFLDELGEFSRQALEALRQPLEEGGLTITRAGHSVDLPCRFMLVAAANPCPCGRGGHGCKCTAREADRYQARLSGALADRVDLFLAIEQPTAEALAGDGGESSAQVRERVAAARERQGRRLGAGRCNAEMDAAEVRRHCRLTGPARTLLEQSHRRLGLSGRGNDRVLKVSRTIADLAGLETIGPEHLEEALVLRRRVVE